jgi:hypothetical protein
MFLTRALNWLPCRLRKREHVREHARAVEDPPRILLDYSLDLHRGRGSIIPWTVYRMRWLLTMSQIG